MSGKLLEDYLSETEMADELGISIRTLRNWRAQRTGPAYARIGRKVTYAKAQGRAWLEGQQQKPLREPRTRSRALRVGAK